VPLETRVRPTGEIVAEPWRGTMMGNRGCLHGPDRRLRAARWRTRAWVCCVLDFRGRWREPMPEGRYTALFFTDEAAALAAGHRPCGECRRPDYRAFRAAWASAGLPGPDLGTADAHLHAARVGSDRRQRRHTAATASLPDGTFVLADGGPCLWWEGALRRWEAGRYAAHPVAPPRTVTVLTPEPTVAVLRAGYRPGVAPGGG